MTAEEQADQDALVQRLVDAMTPETCARISTLLYPPKPAPTPAVDCPRRRSAAA
jgi:hypothetical protein